MVGDRGLSDPQRLGKGPDCDSAGSARDAVQQPHPHRFGQAREPLCVGVGVSLLEHVRVDRTLVRIADAHRRGLQRCHAHTISTFVDGCIHRLMSIQFESKIDCCR